MNLADNGFSDDDEEDQALQTNCRLHPDVLEVYCGCIGGVNVVSVFELLGVNKV